MLAKKFINFKKKDIFLDIGGGAGKSAITSIALLKAKKRYIVDLTQDFVKKFFFMELSKRFKSIKHFKTENLKAKLILMSHALEHFTSNEAKILLEDLTSVISRDGILIVEVPNDDFRNVDELTENNAPHLIFFSKMSLEKILNQCGWELLHTELTSDYFLKGANNRKSIKLFSHFLIDRIFNSFLLKKIENIFKHRVTILNNTSIRIVAKAKISKG